MLFSFYIILARSYRSFLLNKESDDCGTQLDACCHPLKSMTQVIYMQSARPSARPSGSGSGPKRSFSSSPVQRSGSGFRYAGPSRSSAPARSSSGPSRGGFKPRRAGGFPMRKRGGGGFKSESIDHSRYIKRAEVVAEKPYNAKHTFKDFPFVDQLQTNIAKKGFVHPTPIQDQSIMDTLAGRDVFGLANTGTGKTGAFLMPLIDRVARDKNQKVLILAPTRELAQQIDEEFKLLARWMSMYSVSVVGGMPIQRQISEIRRGVSFVIGTPGRVVDLIKRNDLNLAEYSSIVLDEADRMLDMGFRDDMLFILGKCKAERQTLFFSATLSPEIKKMTEQFLKNPLFISVVTGNTSKNVDQDVIRVPKGGDKVGYLHDVLIKEGMAKVLVFRETKRSVDQLEVELRGRGFKVAGIHGDKRNRERMRTLESFKKSEITILIATDVAARGLDIPDVSHVINYDTPNGYDTYVHRIGRTGRANKKGVALTFVTDRG